MKYLILDVLRNLSNYKIFKSLILFLFSWQFANCYSSTENNANEIDINLLRNLQSSYCQLVSLPKEKQENLEAGKAAVSKFANNAVNLSQLTKVLDPEKTKHFIDSLIIRRENNTNISPGKDITDAIEVMLSKDSVAMLNDEISQFSYNMQSRCLSKVINYAVSQSAIDNESKKITRLTIKPKQQIIDNLQPEYKKLLENDEFNTKLTKKLLDMLPNTAIIKLPLIRDIHTITPVVSPYNTVNKPYLEQYFEDDLGKILTSKKQISSAAEQLLPKAEVSSIVNIDAACTLMESITATNNFNSRHKYNKNTKDDYLLKKWINNSIDDFSIKKGYLKYKIQKQQSGKINGKVIQDANMYAITAYKLIDDFLLNFYYTYVNANVLENSDSKTTIHSLCRLACLKVSHKLKNFVISGNYCYGTAINTGRRTDRKYFTHHHNNNSKIHTASINLEYDSVLDRFWLFIPSLFYKHSYYINTKYTETSEYAASSILDCVVNPNNYQYSTFGVGAMLHGRFIISDVYIDPKFSFSVAYNLSHKNANFNISLFETNIKKKSSKKITNKINFGIETSIFGKNISCNVKYLLEINSKYNSNLFCFELCYNF